MHLITVALAVRAGSQGPVLFRQTRVGRDGRTFRMVKFRSMVVDAEERLAEIRHLNEYNGVLDLAILLRTVTAVGRRAGAY